MEAIIILSGAGLVGFLLMAFFSARLSGSLAENKVLRSLDRRAPFDRMAIPIGNKENTVPLKLKIGKFFRESINRLSRSQNKPAEESKDRELAVVGLKGWSGTEWKVLTYAVAGGCLLLGIILFSILSIPPVARIELSIVAGIFGYLLPNTWLKSKIRQRNDEIAKTLPDILDLIMVSVEAGLGFDAAIMKVVEKQKGALSDEFSLVLQEINLGKPRREALKDLAGRNSVDDLSNVVASLVQADQLGISMGNVLRNQSKQTRQKRKQKVQEQAQKAPVKIMIPLVFFIFPSIFIIILGPAVIQIISTLGGNSF